jgi:GrpB-like predicted nucleotidyltransferase (UPF0157 family)
MQQVQLAAYDPTWADQFQDERKILLSIFPDPATRVEHIGSTSVPGLVAKPVIDIMVGVTDLGQAEKQVDALRGVGYEYVPEYEVQKPGRRYFRKPTSRPRTHHLHCVVLGSTDWSRTMAFRDLLRSDPGVASDYAALKLRLAETRTKKGFTDAKTPFIMSVLDSPKPQVDD